MVQCRDPAAENRLPTEAASDIATLVARRLAPGGTRASKRKKRVILEHSLSSLAFASLASWCASGALARQLAKEANARE